MAMIHSKEVTDCTLKDLKYIKPTDFIAGEVILGGGLILTYKHVFIDKK